MEFAKVLQLVATHLKSQGNDWAVVGGLALAVHGAGRMTHDVDIATVRSAQDALVQHFESLGYETLHCSEGYSNHAHQDATMGRVNIVYLDDPTAGELFAAACQSEVVPGVVAKVRRVEHLVAMKVLAAKNDPGRRLQEMADIVALLRAANLAAESVPSYFERHHLIDAWEQVRDSLRSA